jgi:hypothetical protein
VRLLNNVFLVLLVGMISITVGSAWVLARSIKEGDSGSAWVWAVVFLVVCILDAWAFWRLA